MAMRFKEWQTRMTDGKTRQGTLKRTCGIVDALQEVLRQVPQADVVRLELTTNHGKAEVRDGDQFRELVAKHLQPTRAMQDTIIRLGEKGEKKVLSKTEPATSPSVPV
jgi:hypothetical protein